MPGPLPFVEHYYDAFLAELREMLPLGDFFGNSHAIKRMCEALAHPGLHKHNLSGAAFFTGRDLDRGFDPTWRAREEEFRIAVPPALAGALAVFSDLSARGYPIATDYGFSYSAEIARKAQSGVLEETHDACVLAIAVAAAHGLLGAPSRSKFRPLMLMPQTSHRVLAGNSDENWDGDYFFLSEAPGTAAVYFEELTLGRQVRKNRTTITHAEPNEASRIFLKNPSGAKAILWFPHYRLAPTLFGGRVIDQPKDSIAHQGTVLLVHERHLRNVALARALKTSIRESWHELATKPQAAARAAEQLTSDHEYLSFLIQCGGFHDTGTNLDSLR